MDQQHLIELVRKSTSGRNEVIDKLYRDKKLKANTFKFILSKNGSKEDAESIFSDAIINFVKNCYKPDFNLQSSIENYLFGVTRNLWYRTIRKRIKDNEQELDKNVVDFETPEILLMGEEKRNSLNILLQKLDENCRKVLQMWALNMKMKMIAAEMNYSSAEVVRKKKHFCLKKLITIVDAHPEYRELLKSNL